MSTLPSSRPLLFTVEQAAEQLQVSKSMIYALVDGGKLACHRIGMGRGTIRFSEDDLKLYLDSIRHGTWEPKPKVKRRSKLKHIQL